MGEIIFLVHRLPFPPDKGDKIRSYHLLRHLTARHKVHLGCFIDDVDDEKYLEEVESLCASAQVRRLNPLIARAKSLKGLITNQALSLPYYYDKVLAAWVENILRTKQIESIIAYSSPMGQYVMGSAFTGYRRIMDFVDVDSDKWQQYAEEGRGLMRWVYRREARLLLDFERAVAKSFDAVTFVSRNETELFSRLSPDTVQKHFAVQNGVDLDFFDSELAFESPYAAESRPIVFTGMMNYWPNVDAVVWFAKTILPQVRRSEPHAELWIVGSSPTRTVEDLGQLPGVRVTGRVPDVRPYLRYAAVAIAPLRIARGVQNKVLEALAMGCRVVSSPEALAGLEKAATAPVQRATCSSEWVDYVVQAQQDASCNGCGAGPAYVRRYYDWNANLSLLEELLVAEDDMLPLALPHPEVFLSTHGN